jgi:hypothetical protein
VYPFDPSQTDRLNRRITNPLVADPTGTFTLLRWGDAVVTVTPEFTGAFLHGVIGTEPLYVFTFSKVQDPPPPSSF